MMKVEFINDCKGANIPSTNEMLGFINSNIFNIMQVCLPAWAAYINGASSFNCILVTIVNEYRAAVKGLLHARSSLKPYT